MSQRKEHWRAFSPKWFEQHQRILLWLLNVPVLGRWFRWVLCIRACDIGHHREILEIQPHCYTVPGEQAGTLTTDFRTHWKYAKRLYYAFRPLWWVMHWWDRLADTRLPQWSFGFATLTAYPDPHPETTTVDGQVSRLVFGPFESFNTIRNSSGTFASDAGTSITVSLISASVTDEYQNMIRSVLLFDTSAIGGQIVDSSTLGLWVTSTLSQLGDTTVDTCSSSPASNIVLANGDYDTIGSSGFGNVAISVITTSSYTLIAMNAAGIANVSRSGISKFGARLGWDLNNSFTGAWGSVFETSITASSADESGTGQDPKLEVTYSAPSYMTRPLSVRPSVFSPGIAR